MKHLVVIASVLLCSSSIATATVTTYNSSAEFQAANPDVVLIENFEDSDPSTWGPHLSSYTGPQGLISFTPIGGSPEPNLTIAPPWYDTFAGDLNPIGSFVLTSNGNEEIIGTLNAPATALGFDLFLNDSPGTVSFFNGDTLLAILTFDSPPVEGDNETFAGIFSSEGITSFRWDATNGQNIDTGIDNIYAGPAPVPEPSTWAMMLFGFGLAGAALRRQKAKAIAQAA